MKTQDFLPQPGMFPSWQEWAAALMRWLEAQQQEEAIPIVPSYSVADLPRPTLPGMMVKVTDDVMGEIPAWSNSAGQWVRADGTEVEAAP